MTSRIIAMSLIILGLIPAMGLDALWIETPDYRVDPQARLERSHRLFPPITATYILSCIVVFTVKTIRDQEALPVKSVAKATARRPVPLAGILGFAGRMIGFTILAFATWMMWFVAMAEAIGRFGQPRQIVFVRGIWVGSLAYMALASYWGSRWFQALFRRLETRNGGAYLSTIAPRTSGIWDRDLDD